MPRWYSDPDELRQIANRRSEHWEVTMNYFVRVELHNANRLDYDVLHNAMAARGFQRTIRGDDGILYQLPTAEYVIGTTASGEHVRSAAGAAAKATGKSSAVLVARYEHAWWSGLAQVRAA